MRRSAAPRKRAAMVNSLPMTLRVYRKLSFAVVPLAPALIKRRLKLGKEDPARIGERRGFSDDVRPRRPPMVLINGRMSHRSFPRWRRVSGTISALLGKFDLCLAQSQIDAERFAALGSHNVVITGNLKLDVPAPPADPSKLERLISLTRGRPIVVAASTHPGEEELLLEAHRTLKGFFPSLLTVIVPRHPDRGAAIARMIAASGQQAGLRSREDVANPATDIYVAGTP